MKIASVIIFALLAINISHAEVPKGNLVLEVISEHDGPLIGPKHPDTTGNKGGFETGCLLRADGICHMFVNEMFGTPHRQLRIAHWISKDGFSWHRKGIVFDSIPGRSPFNFRSELWVQCVIYNEVHQRWNMFYVAYRSGNKDKGESAGSDYDGKIFRAVSLTKGFDGIDGPYCDVDIVMRPDTNSLPWEGQQGVDSFFPYRVGNKWYALYGSHNHLPLSPWLVGLAQAPSLFGPWQRVAEHSPAPLSTKFIENPVVAKITPDKWLAVFDCGAPNAIGYSVSKDGVHWGNEQTLVVQSKGNRWAGDDGIHELRTPLGLLPQDDGTYILLYTAKMKKTGFYAIGQCIVRLATQ